MKFRTLIFGLIAVSFLASLFAEAPKVTGINQYEAVAVEKIDGTGLIKLNGTTVDSIRLVGSLLSQDAEIGSLDITGEANFKNCTIKNSGTILGSLQAVHSTFKDSITILSQKAVFTNSRLEGITVQKDTGYKGKQIIELRQGTLINGPVHFESGKGEIIVFPGSQVLGPVTGGKIVKKS